MSRSADTIAAAAWALARVLIVIGLIPNGIRKILTFDMVAAMMGGAAPVLVDGRPFPAQEPLFHFPVPGLFLAAAIVFDIAGSALIIVGYRTRFAAAMLCAYVVLAMLVFHTDISGPQDIVAILRNLPLLGGLLLLAAIGAGPWSLDERASIHRRYAGDGQVDTGNP